MLAAPASRARSRGRHDALAAVRGSASPPHPAGARVFRARMHVAAVLGLQRAAALLADLAALVGEAAPSTFYGRARVTFLAPSSARRASRCATRSCSSRT